MIHPRDINGEVLYDQLVPCACRGEQWYRERQQQLLHVCELPADSAHLTLDSFQTYKEKSLIQAKEAAIELSSPEGKIKWLTLIGGVDTGKSHLGVAICHKWLESGFAARYVFVPKMLDDLRSSYEHDAGRSYSVQMGILLKVPLLVLDDLGTQKPTEWANEKLVSIINERYENALPLVVTTNIDISQHELPGDYEHRIASRLLRFSAGKVIELQTMEHRLRLI